MKTSSTTPWQLLWNSASHPTSPTRCPFEDDYARLEWFTGRAEEFGFDPRRLLIDGQSAGGGLSAGTTLLARDPGRPMPAALLLMWPAPDDRNQTVSAQQIDRRRAESGGGDDASPAGVWRVPGT
jgi:acetyl esterase/lipase